MTTPVTFTGTPGVLLPAYDANWEKVTDGGAINGDWKIGPAEAGSGNTCAKRATASQNGMAVYKGTVPSQANYLVSAGFIKRGNSTERIGIMGRASDTSRNGYLVRWTNGTSVTLALMKATGASPVIMGSTITLTDITVGVPRNIGLLVEDDQISAVDLDNGGATLIGPITDTDHSSAGHIGLWYTSDSTSATTTTGVEIDNLDLEYLDAPVIFEAESENRADVGAALSTAIQMAAGVVGTSVIAAALMTGSAFLAAEAKAGGETSAALATGISLAAEVRASSSIGAALSYPTTYVDIDFPGCNVDGPSVVVTDANTLTPIIQFLVRTPDDAEWQQYVTKARNVRLKHPIIRVSVAGKETDPDTYLGSYQGPWWAPSITDETWNLVASFSVSGGYKQYQIDVGDHDDIYIASVPPATQETVFAWIGRLAAAYPNLIHDDLQSRQALAVSDPPNAGPYICGRTGVGRDENGREVSNLPIPGFRMGNDAVGSLPKRRIVVFCQVHTGEWNAHHVMRGFAAEYASGPSSAYLQQNFDVYFYPLQSPLGNYLGSRRAEARPDGVFYDANREWTDGDTTVPTVVKCQQIMDLDHGVNHADKVVVFLDFHDGKKTSAKSWYYYQPGFAHQAAWHAIVTAQNSEIGAEESDADGTTQDYWWGKGVAFTFNPEVADEKSTLAELAAFGAAYARSLKAADEAALLPVFEGQSAEVSGGGAAAADLTTAIRLVSSVDAGGMASATLDTAIHLQAVVSGNASITADLLIADAPFAVEMQALANVDASLTTDVALAASISVRQAIQAALVVGAVMPPFVPPHRRLALKSESRKLYL